MRVHLYSVCWNDARILPYFFRHYDPIVDRYVIYDDGSDDASATILARHPRVTVRPMPHADSNSYLKSATALRDQMWKESRGHADWVIVTDVDEHLHHPVMATYLQRCRDEGVTAIPGTGFQMISDRFPEPEAVLWHDYPRGARARFMDKLAMFDPNNITDTRFTDGRHGARLTGRVRYPSRDEVLNLHYRYLGAEYVLQRNAEHLARLPPADQARLATSYGLSGTHVQAQIDRWDRAAVDISDQHITRPENPMSLRWRRQPPWWRERWWHLRSWRLQWWWAQLPAQVRRPIVRWAKTWRVLPRNPIWWS